LVCPGDMGTINRHYQAKGTTYTHIPIYQDISVYLESIPKACWIYYVDIKITKTVNGPF
jgi:hypothetical protein